MLSGSEFDDLSSDANTDEQQGVYAKVVVCGGMRVGKSLFIHKAGFGTAPQNLPTTVGADCCTLRFSEKDDIFFDGQPNERMGDDADETSSTLPGSRILHTRKVVLSVWDLASGIRAHPAMLGMFGRGAEAAMFLFDVTKRATLNEIRDFWLPEFVANNPKTLQNDSSAQFLCQFCWGDARFNRSHPKTSQLCCCRYGLHAPFFPSLLVATHTDVVKIHPSAREVSEEEATEYAAEHNLLYVEIDSFSTELNEPREAFGLLAHLPKRIASFISGQQRGAAQKGSTRLPRLDERIPRRGAKHRTWE